MNIKIIFCITIYIYTEWNFHPLLCENGKKFLKLNSVNPFRTRQPCDYINFRANFMYFQVFILTSCIESVLYCTAPLYLASFTSGVRVEGVRPSCNVWTTLLVTFTFNTNKNVFSFLYIKLFVSLTNCSFIIIMHLCLGYMHYKIFLKYL